MTIIDIDVEQLKRLIQDQKDALEQLELKVKQNQEQKNFKNSKDEYAFRYGWVDNQLRHFIKKLEVELLLQNEDLR